MELKEELLKQKYEIIHKLCDLEFEEKGFKKILKEGNIPYKLFYRTPLGKNNQWQITIGIPKKEFNLLIDNKTIIIIGITNPREVDSHIYYVFLPPTGKGGYSTTDEYIDIKRKIENRWEILLPTIEEYLNGKEKEKTNS